jgi:2-polyprenyl-6-methoxyphenol hydroxylase-like FAD-dependent oxidoreductase
MMSEHDSVAIIGGGIAGLALALSFHAKGIPFQVYEAAAELKELGVGITLLPHAMRELAALGLEPAIAAIAIENRQSAFFNRFGQLIYSEARGRFAGNPFPEFGIHRGGLHRVLHQALVERAGHGVVRTGHRLAGLEQDDAGVVLRFAHGGTARAGIAVACDGVNSAVRQAFYPGETVVFTGINTWRGTTRRKPILDGRTYMRIGSLRTGKIVVYPIADNIDADGRQLINWTTEIQSDEAAANDWNKPGSLDDFIGLYESWRFDWLDVTALIRDADHVFEYPMVDKDPVARWTFGRVTLCGDAAHPMYPRGSNGSAQALIDARTLAELLARGGDRPAALQAYEAARLEPTARVVRTNRESPPDLINMRVEELTGDRPFDDLSTIISQEELRAISDRYKAVAGFAAQDLVGGRH